jgi:CelD/BcsL family acetyltransferase involved in cellulose biosynthesis
MSATADRSRPNPNGALEVEGYSTADAFVSLRDEWIDLEKRASTDNLFLTYMWQHSWWQDLGDRDGRVLDLVAFRDAGRLVGIAPTYQEQAGGFTLVRFGGGLEVTDYLGFMVEPAYEKAAGRAFLERCLTRPGLVLDLHYLRSDGVTLKAIIQAAADLDRRFSVEEEEVSPRIELPSTWDEYLARLGKKHRHELRRKRRRLEDAGGWTITETSQATLANDLEVFFDVHAKSMREKADFMTEDIKTFFRHICGHLEEEGWLSLRTLVHEGRPLAAVLGFVYRGTLLLYNSGYDPEYNQLAPGFVLMTEEIRLTIEAGLSEVDFLRGNEKYKYDLGATDRPLVHLTVELS